MASHNLALLSLVLGALAVGFVAWFFEPDLPWWGFILLFVVVSGGLFSRLVRDLGSAKLVDSDKL